MENAYTSFASVYDTYMENVPYEEWAAHLIERLISYGIKDGIVVDLGCGTGVMTRLLRDAGYDMIGIDGSEDMLEEAREAEYLAMEDAFSEEEVFAEDRSILYLCQDMREMELYGTVAAIVSVCDCINYITEPEDLLKVFKLANNYLEERGYFIFDINSEYKYETLLADRIFAENSDDGSFIWENEYDPKTRINEYDLTLYILDDDETGNSYSRYEEVHRQRAYKVEEICSLLEKAGMEFVGAFDGYSSEPANDQSERILIVAREGHQEGKSYVPVN